MVQYIFTPWRDRRELLTVRSQLYPHQPNSTTSRNDDLDRHEVEISAVERLQQQEAVSRVSMWMQRGACPHMVESTALLMAAILTDQDSPSSSSAYAVRAAYSAAFSRYGLSPLSLPLPLPHTLSWVRPDLHHLYNGHWKV